MGFIEKQVARGYLEIGLGLTYLQAECILKIAEEYKKGKWDEEDKVGAK